MTLTPCCQLCATSQSLLRCSVCKVVRYCSKDHQLSDWPQHKSACNTIKRCCTRLDRHELELRNQQDEGMFSAKNVFEEHVGHFWGLLNTRPYMRARHVLVEGILKIPTYDAVVAALNHVVDCLRLCRGDNMGVRDLVPALLLRLDRDQECYDFVKWYATTGKDSHYDWGNMDEPYLDIKDADLLESPLYMCRHYLNLSHVVSITLLKIKLLLAVRAGSKGRDILRSSQVFNRIENVAIQSTTGDSQGGIAEVIKVLKLHVNMVYQAVDDSSVHFWNALISPGRHLEARPQLYGHGSVEEMQLVLQQSYDAWKETPEAIEVIKAITNKKDY